ncbi:hypothetical protein C7B82_17255 [Stenomitos frigidus ULC18]|uniref:Uncharacterized protein n=1 Tax=Stenomitos frigidus ULC18 TaxID=2107698 RepID=A0A2T1E3A3_9CYAN|nr:hypothetical protein C7B82_17255 [Stenomitos frigidus ULC18]
MVLFIEILVLPLLDRVNGGHLRAHASKAAESSAKLDLTGHNTTAAMKTEWVFTSNWSARFQAGRHIVQLLSLSCQCCEMLRPTLANQKVHERIIV